MRFTLLPACLCLLALIGAPFARSETISIAAAISIKEALLEAEIAYAKETGDEVEFSFGASGVLLTQIKNGAPIDGFISAASEQVDELEKSKLAVAGSRRVVAMNGLVLIVPAGSKLKLTSIKDLTRDDVKKIAIGQPKSVPAGQYAMQTLASLKLDQAIAGKIVNGANVRQVLDYVQRGEVDAGFVYATDAQQIGDRVKVIANAPADSHEPIVYSRVIVAASKKQAAADRFLSFLGSPAGKQILEKRGFITEAPAKTTTQPASK